MGMEKLRRGDVNYFSKSFAKSQIDEDNGILRDVVLVQEGEAKGHGVFLDGKFVKRITKLGKAQGESGVKSRFGHPAMSEDANGTQLGRFKNFRNRTMADGEGVESVADLHLFSEDILKASNKVPDLEWFVGMARDNDDAFGNSIVFHSAGTEEREFELEDGEFETREFELPPLSFPWSDLVNEGAATDSLFASEMMIDKVVNFLESNKDIYEMLCKHPDAISKVETVLNRVKSHEDYKSNQSKTMSEITENVEEIKEVENEATENTLLSKFESLFNKFSTKKEEVEPAKSEVELLEEKYLSKFNEIEVLLNSKEEAFDSLTEEHVALKSEFDTLTEDYGKLSRKEATAEELNVATEPALDTEGVEVVANAGKSFGENLAAKYKLNK